MAGAKGDRCNYVPLPISEETLKEDLDISNPYKKYKQPEAIKDSSYQGDFYKPPAISGSAPVAPTKKSKPFPTPFTMSDPSQAQNDDNNVDDDVTMNQKDYLHGTTDGKVTKKKKILLTMLPGLSWPVWVCSNCSMTGCVMVSRFLCSIIQLISNSLSCWGQWAVNSRTSSTNLVRSCQMIQHPDTQSS